MSRALAQTATLNPIEAHKHKLVLAAFLVLAVYLMAASQAYAQTYGTGVASPMGAVMCDIVYIIYGNLGRGLAIIAIAILGAGATLGKVTWGLALTVGTGIAVLFGAGTIATYFINNASDYAGTGC